MLIYTPPVAVLKVLLNIYLVLTVTDILFMPNMHYYLCEIEKAPSSRQFMQYIERYI